jgi:hypothetical protein
MLKIQTEEVDIEVEVDKEVEVSFLQEVILEEEDSNKDLNIIE